MGQTSKHWRILASDESLWKCIVKARPPHEYLVDCEHQFSNVLHKSDTSNSKNRVIVSCYRKFYLQNQQLEHRWIQGNPITNIIEPGTSIDKLVMADDKIVFVSNREFERDYSIRVWTLEGNCLGIFSGHSETVHVIYLQGNLVVSGSRDCTLRVWDIAHGRCVKTCNGHLADVRCLDISDGTVASGSDDCTVRMWCLHSGECLRVFVGHVARINCVTNHGDVVISASDDGFVRIWDTDDGRCKHALDGHAGPVGKILCDRQCITASCGNRFILVWKLIQSTWVCSLSLGDVYGRTFAQRGDIIAAECCTEYELPITRIKAWDIHTGLCKYTLDDPRVGNIRMSPVQHLRMIGPFLAGMSDVGALVVMNLGTGSYVRSLTLCPYYNGGWCCDASKVVCYFYQSRTPVATVLVADFAT